MPESKTQLLFILKAPVVGMVKTRLAEDIGEVRALAAYRAMVEHLFDNLASRWPFEIHYTPARDVDLMHSWLGPDHPYFPQPEGDLGHRMARATEDAFERGANSVILLGGDCPYVTPDLIRQAVGGLEANEVVIGPAVDGGYYLLGLNRPQRRLFEEISWSTESVFPVTLERVKEKGLTVKILPTLEDVDDLQSLTHAEAYMGKPIAVAE